MGIFDLFTKKNDQAEAAKRKAPSPRELARLDRLVSDKLAQNYDRQDAIATLGEMANAEGARALLRRFDFSMQPTITDQEEKESALEGIVAAGEQALEPIQAYCARAESITWALRALRRIVPQERVVEEHLHLLDQFDTDYMRNPEPKIQLIAVLEEFREDSVRKAVEPFVMDTNESVRFHAVGTLFAMENPESAQVLTEALIEEESLRVKNRIAGGLSQRQWEIPASLHEALRAALPSEFSLQGSKIVRH
ncbi:MAG TPA: HEAT repeat domain-containing protein [Polyangiaceae bacterium]|nr:HEAT repeat domain-containing protein [Polyangiaceae bacterium]